MKKAARGPLVQALLAETESAVIEFLNLSNPLLELT